MDVIGEDTQGIGRKRRCIGCPPTHVAVQESNEEAVPVEAAKSVVIVDCRSQNKNPKHPDHNAAHKDALQGGRETGVGSVNVTEPRCDRVAEISAETVPSVAKSIGDSLTTPVFHRTITGFDPLFANVLIVVITFISRCASIDSTPEMRDVQIGRHRSIVVSERDLAYADAQLKRFRSTRSPLVDLEALGDLIGMQAYFRKHVSELEAAKKSTKSLEYANSLKGLLPGELGSLLTSMHEEVRPTDGGVTTLLVTCMLEHGMFLLSWLPLIMEVHRIAPPFHVFFLRYM